MVKFEWSWADYERCKRAEERKIAKAAPPRVSEPDHIPDAGEVVEDDKAASLAALREQLQTCDLCGKKRIKPCNDRGCPLL